MEFFNKKEEVIDLQLTQYGRHLLSKGHFKPVFYSFHDDNILYNTANQGIQEGQNEAQPRIEETPTMKPQVSFSSLEKEFLNNYNKVISGQEKLGGKSQQPTAIKNYSLPQPLGTSDINKENAPAMSLKFLQGSIEPDADNKPTIEETLSLSSGLGSHILRIPQIFAKLEVDYKNVVIANDFYEVEDPGASVGIVTKEDETYIVIKLDEENAPFQKKNFDIEVFDMGTVTASSDQTLRPLHFIKDQPFEEDFDFITLSPPDITQENVSYYFDLLTDDEIEESIICNLDVDMTKKGVFIDKKIKECQILEDQKNKKVFDIYEPETDDPGEVC